MDDAGAQWRIRERALAGLIAAKAEHIIIGDDVLSDHIVERDFWADGREALQEDWAVGDFTSCPDGLNEVKAFGVSFDFLGLGALLGAHEQAEALRRISVIADSNWISASALLAKLGNSRTYVSPSAVLAEACLLGKLGGRAMRATCHGRRRNLLIHRWTALEWDVPLWFWRNFTQAESANFSWLMDKMRGEGRQAGEATQIELQGLHFHKSGLTNLGLFPDPAGDEQAPQAKRGRKPEYDWPAANTAIWGQIMRGELMPRSQAVIEKALQVHLAKGDKEPSESTVRPHASQIWAEYSKA
jgi:hypothetical protein